MIFIFQINCELISIIATFDFVCKYVILVGNRSLIISTLSFGTSSYILLSSVNLREVGFIFYFRFMGQFIFIHWCVVWIKQTILDHSYFTILILGFDGGRNVVRTITNWDPDLPSTRNEALNICLVCWDILVSFPFTSMICRHVACRFYLTLISCYFGLHYSNVAVDVIN